ncbi:hypothetical protein EJ08DRAFT_359917 [Tothia fuscella]|uniref:Carboxymuconolactone decarboxylase-like domain-containing protein n=1 Tax=Tothia fuscella TaxID=1048955 RepID=A0A9P4NMB6_9PEZI|nr:hypothetical protein EJ08DRAFT_359917 [Tothia fuscella]
MQDGDAIKGAESEPPWQFHNDNNYVAELFGDDDKRYLATKSLCQSVQSSFPKSMGEDAWYIVVTSTLITCGQPDAIRYIFAVIVERLRQQQETVSPKDTNALSAKLKDVLMKQWTLIGIPLVISAVPHLAKATTETHAFLEKERQAQSNTASYTPDPVSIPPSMQQQEESSHYTPKTIDTTTESRGHAFMQQIYLHNLPRIMSTWGPHQADFEWLEKRIIYGLFLSDHVVLTGLEAELVTLSSIMAQGLRLPSLWHVRGLMRLGIGEGDVEGVCDAVKGVTKWAGREGTEGWIRAGEVDAEMDDPRKSDGSKGKR